MREIADRDLIYDLRAEKGLSYIQIGKIVGRDKSRVQQICKELGLCDTERMMLDPSDPGILGATPPPRVPLDDPLLARLRQYHGESNV